jgi:mannosyltransferase
VNAVLHRARLSVAGHHLAFEYPLLVAISLLAAGLRFYKLGEWSFWLDEIITVTASAHIADWSLTRLPLYLVFTRATLELFGTTEWSARLAPALTGVLTIPALYFPTRRLFGPAVALMAAVLLAVAPWHLFWSQNARFYVLLLLFYNLGLLFFLIGLREKRPYYFFLALLFLVLAARERSTAFFFVPVIVTYLAMLRLFSPGRPVALQRRVLVPLFSLAIAFGFYDLTLLLFGLPGSLIGSVWRTFVGNQNHDALRLGLSMVFQMGVPLICLGGVAGLHLILKPSANEETRHEGIKALNVQPSTLNDFRRTDGAILFIFVGAVLPPLLLLLLSLFMFTVDRYVFMTLPFWTILAAAAVKQLFNLTEGHGRLLGWAVLLMLLLTSLAQVVLYYEFQNGNRPAWRQAFAVVAQRQMPGDLVLSTTPRVGHHYLNPNVRDINSITAGELESNTTRTWFVIDEAIGWVKPSLHAWIRQNASLVDVMDGSMPGKSLAIRVYLHEPDS